MPGLPRASARLAFTRHVHDAQPVNGEVPSERIAWEIVDAAVGRAPGPEVGLAMTMMHLAPNFIDVGPEPDAAVGFAERTGISLYIALDGTLAQAYLTDDHERMHITELAPERLMLDLRRSGPVLRGRVRTVRRSFPVEFDIDLEIDAEFEVLTPLGKADLKAPEPGSE